MKLSSQARLVALLISAAAGAVVVAQPAADQKALVPTTIDSIQFDGQWPWLFLDRPIKDQGLDAINQRGRVRPIELLKTGKDFSILPEAKGGVTSSVRTIFRDLYTGAEVWRLTNYTTGAVSNAYNIPWNANGRFMRFKVPSNGTFLIDHESSAMVNHPVHKWSPTDPYVSFSTGNSDGKRGVWAYDLRQPKPRFLAPLAPKTGNITSVSHDGKWVMWLEGHQDEARRFGVAATDGSLYRSFRHDGGIAAEIKNPTPDIPPPITTAGDSDVKGGIHYGYFTRDADGNFKVYIGVNGPVNQVGGIGVARFIDLDGKLTSRAKGFSHGTNGPDGKLMIFEGPGGVRAYEHATGKDWLHFNARGKIEGHTSWTNDPHWAECSWQSPFGWEIVRLGMREDASPIRLCGVCPQDPQTMTYNGDPFGQLSPDGTKVAFMSSMMGAMNEYMVVAANPRPPQKLTGQWTPEGFKLTWTPDKLSGEAKGYRIYQTDKSGQTYRQIGWVDTPESQMVPYKEPISFTVPGVKQGEKVFFAVRAQEWSGLLSRYSNDVASDASMPVATYIEPELGEFTGFKQGFDPVNAGDMYYLFVPTEGTKCSVSFTNPNKDAQVWVRVSDSPKKFMVHNAGNVMPGNAAMPPQIYTGWQWRNLGKISGEITLSSEEKGFKLDRIFLTSDGSTPTGRGLDYPTAATVIQVPTNVKTKPLTPFASEVTWAAIPGIRYYNVYVADKPDFVPAQSNLLYSPPAGTERIVDWGLKPGTQYYYKITAIDYDGSVSQPSAAVALATSPITVHTVNVDYSAGTGGSVQADATASNGKHVTLKAEDTYTLKFNVPADGDYVIWHQWRSTIAGDWHPLEIQLNDKKETLRESYHMGAL
ncbi:MAG: hypothetical protein FWD53_11210, partial [Phycisphaerales bacterium]|nr:hypothetical protein [Phycisphaerales bacterium]